MLRAVRHLLELQSARGGEIRVLTARSQRRSTWQETPQELFQWHTVVSVPWRQADTHINVCEARARQLSVRWRARQVSELGCRYLHLLDSQANLSAAAKGRTGSSRMRHVQLRTSATLLAARLRDVNGYTRSDRNPADAPSRALAAWAAYRKERLASRRTRLRRLAGRPPPVTKDTKREERRRGRL